MDEPIDFVENNNTHIFILKEPNKIIWIEIDSSIIIGILSELMKNDIPIDIRRIIFNKIVKNLEHTHTNVIIYDLNLDFTDNDESNFDWHDVEWPDTD